MGRNKISKKVRLENYVKIFGSDVFKTDGNKIYCKVCDDAVSADQKCQIEQHTRSSKHKSALEKMRSGTSGVQQFISESFQSQVENNGKSEFEYDLCEAFISANIPLDKLENEKIKALIKKYTSYKVPAISTVRAKHLPKLYNKTLEIIREKIGEHKLWISVDETMDKMKRSIANVIVGILNSEKSETFLINCEVLEAVNSQSIASLICDSLRKLWNGNIKSDNILFLVTDAATYMKKAAVGLKVFFPKLIHITCVAHGLHNVCEEIRKNFPKVNDLIANVKSIFKNVT